MKPPKMPAISDHISPEMMVVEPDEKSKFGFSVPEIIFTYGDIRKGLRNLLRVFPTLIRTRRNALKGYQSIAENPVSGNRIADPAFFSELEEYIHSLGILDIGFTEVPRSYIFSNKQILFDKAIVMTMEMNKESMSRAPGPAAGKEVWRTYHDLGLASNKVAEFLRRRGFAAQPGPALGGETNYCMLAQKAGLGRIGKHGILISPETGPSLRIAAVYTDIENLPLTDSRAGEYAWISEFCRTCLRCVRKCPAGAIFEQNEIDEKGRQKAIDYKKCAVPFSQTIGCSICIRECTFFKGDYHKIQKSYLGKK